MTWRKGSSSMAYLSAYDEHSVIILPFEEMSWFVENGTSVSNVLRFRHDLGEASHIGLVATDRRFDSGGSGTLVGVDGQIRLSASNTAQVQLLATHTEEVNNPALVPDSSFNVTRFDRGRHTAGLDGESFWGHGLFAELERSTGDYWADVEYSELSPTFRADNGFEPSNNRRMASSDIGGIVRFDNSTILENINGNVNATRKWNFDNVQKDEWINASVEAKFRAAQTGIHSQYMASNELFRGIHFNGIWLVHTCLSTQPGGSLSFGGNIDYGHRIARRDLVMGKEKTYGVWADIRPIDRMLISSSYSYVSSDDLETDEHLFSQSVFRSTLSLQMSREFSLRLITQYNDRYDTWDVDPLLTYRINSLTVFYIGSTHRYSDLTIIDDGRDGWTLTDRQYFLKLQYLFRI